MAQATWLFVSRRLNTSNRWPRILVTRQLGRFHERLRRIEDAYGDPAALRPCYQTLNCSVASTHSRPLWLAGIHV